MGDTTGNAYSLQNGNCTNGVNGAGAFSGAALASQALSGLSQTATTETNRTATNAIADRRAEETQRSRTAEQTRTRDTQARADAARDRRRPAPEQVGQADARDEAARSRRASARAAATRARQAEARADAAAARKADAAAEEADAMARRSKARAEADRAARAEARADAARARRSAMARRSRQDEAYEPAPMPSAPYRQGLVRKGYDPVEPPPPVAYLIETPRYGAFAQGFGDFEQRNGRASSNVQYNGTGTPQTFSFDIIQKSTTRTAGFVGGMDVTVRNTFEPGDGAIFGLLTGYTDTSISIATRTVSANTANLPNGSASTKVALTGPSVGVFATYFNKGFSIDQTFKADFYGLDQTFTESSGFGGTFTPGLGPGLNGAAASKAITLTGTGRTGVTQVSAIGNMNYRLFATDAVWFEPTVGYQYTHSSYEQSAAELGLRDGYLIRVQGGARIGVETFLGNARLTTTLTGLAYENIVIDGGFIQAGAFGSNVIALNDEGKLRGQGILTFALDHGNGVSSFVQGDVRGGDRYFAAGGRAGFRYQW